MAISKVSTPKPAPAPAPKPAPAPAPKPAPAPAPKPTPAPAPTVISQNQSTYLNNLVKEGGGAAAWASAQLKGTTVASPAPKPAPAPVAAPAPIPSPAPAPVSVPAPKPSPTPVPASTVISQNQHTYLTNLVKEGGGAAAWASAQLKGTTVATPAPAPASAQIAAKGTYVNVAVGNNTKTNTSAVQNTGNSIDIKVSDTKITASSTSSNASADSKQRDYLNHLIKQGGGASSWAKNELAEMDKQAAINNQREYLTTLSKSGSGTGAWAKAELQKLEKGVKRDELLEKAQRGSTAAKQELNNMYRAESKDSLAALAKNSDASGQLARTELNRRDQEAKAQAHAALLSRNAQNKMIDLGDQGESVIAIQEKLKAMGYNISADGKFGAQTQAAVAQFQKNHGLKADGVVGNQTLNVL
ncbi:peptidoglycan-binding protein [Cohnella sp.]|uniref:peptidoglycan-binding protein n=1 Tax=Cohnella sp. TaxID=1883426 RepID=UPI00356304D1